MGISFKKYIDITSGLGVATQTSVRELIGRLFTTNLLLPTGSVMEFTSAEEVGNYFGTSSVEYLRAAFYFSFISKNITSPKKISYARWVDSAVAPMIFGYRFTASLTTLKLITNGSFTLTMGTDTHNIGALDFSSATSLSDIAGIIEAGINAQTGTQWTASTVAYNATSGGFDLVGGDAVPAIISVAAGTTGTNIATTIGWFPQYIGSTGAIWSDGATVQTITQVLTQSTELSNNFGSFLFIPLLTLDQIVEAANWNSAKNVLYQFYVRVPSIEDGPDYNSSLINAEGTGLTLAPLANYYPEQVPMMVLASTKYTQRNATQNFMFQVVNGLPPSVTTTADSDTLDSLRINYYGQTQQAGQPLNFYQRGFLMGQGNSPVNMNTYANEQWLKDAAGVAIMNLFLAVAEVSANDQGRSQVLTILQDVVNQALNNGTISVNGVLTQQQKLYITEITDDPNAWRQVFDAGYWLDAYIEPYVGDSGITEYKAIYTLVYKKDDVVRKVEGTHVLI